MSVLYELVCGKSLLAFRIPKCQNRGRELRRSWCEQDFESLCGHNCRELLGQVRSFRQRRIDSALGWGHKQTDLEHTGHVNSLPYPSCRSRTTASRSWCSRSTNQGARTISKRESACPEAERKQSTSILGRTRLPYASSTRTVVQPSARLSSLVPKRSSLRPKISLDSACR